jgi:hypothetical protein
LDKSNVYVIEELSYNNVVPVKLVNLGQVPLLIKNVGVFYRQLFNEQNLFEAVSSSHVFQSLTESNKSSKAFRSGIYLTNVATDEDTGGSTFNLLRCSSNFSGPTDNFQPTDRMIIDQINKCCTDVFDQSAEFNHVLAQIYKNSKVGSKEKKAKIKAHTDKTKDMPPNALIAFCTFYDSFHDELKHIKRSKLDKFDWCYNDASVLTKLVFRLKPTVTDHTLVKVFSVTLYPNSAFVISLLINRLYTHEIRPSDLNIDHIPTRMGYVIRCSNTKALHVNQTTYICEDDQLVKLEPITPEDAISLRELYFKENTTTDIIDYSQIYFSMNDGDYQQPLGGSFQFK